MAQTGHLTYRGSKAKHLVLGNCCKNFFQKFVIPLMDQISLYQFFGKKPHITMK